MENILIEMEQITSDYVPKMSGIYLVRTVSTSKMKSVHYFQARVNLNNGNEKNPYSIDVSNQIATHISVNPLKLSITDKNE